MELSDRLQRTGSLIEPDPQEQLLKFFQKRNHDKFIALLDNNQVDINYYYGEPDFGTLLDLCVTQENSTQFLRSLLTRGADPNIINKMRKKSPLHFLIERNDIKNLSVLLEYVNKVDINVVDNFGNTPLHYSAKGQKKAGTDTTVLQMLLNVPSVNVNAINRKGQTPAHLAAVQGHKDALLLLVRTEGIDLETSKDFSNKSAKDLITEKYSDIMIPEKSLISLPLAVTPDYVFSLLRANNVSLFKKVVSENKDLINCTDGLYTLLQHACDHGFYEIADFLILQGADVNKTNNSMQYTPIMLASRKGFHRIVQRLVKSDIDVSYSPINMESVFHCVVMGSVENSQLGDSDEEKDHLACLDVLVNNMPNSHLINRGDSKGNTPLHYAGRMCNDEMVFKLLHYGAYAGCLNIFGDPALAYISPSIFEKYLDKCVTTNDKVPREEGYEIILNYKCFVPPDDSSTSDSTAVDSSGQNNRNRLNGTDLLLYTSESPDIKHLLMHPVAKGLIFMKWFNIRKWYYINLIFYLFFWALLTIYILGVYDTLDQTNHSINNKTENEEEFKNNNNTKGPLWYIVLFLLLLLVARELFQFKKGYINYLTNPENWLELGLIVLTFVIFLVNVSEDTKHQLSAAAILFSWTELVLLIGKHPSLSTHIEMLKTVGWTFLKFLAWYSILIVAFALSFYTLFRNAHEEGDDSKVFIDPGVSVFKTIVMLTGEFEAGEIPFDRYPYTGHTLFVLFVFAIAIVLYNLLNGLAVSDTQAIKSDAEMVAYISRIKVVSFFETVDLLRFKNLINSIISCNFSRGNEPGDSPSCHKTIFSDVKDHEIHIFPNDGNKIELSSAPKRAKRNVEDDPGSCYYLQSCRDNVMESSIIKAAQTLLNKKQEMSESCADFSQYSINEKILDEFKKTLTEYKIVLHKMTETEKSIKKLLNKSGDLSITDLNIES